MKIAASSIMARRMRSLKTLPHALIFCLLPALFPAGASSDGKAAEVRQKTGNDVVPEFYDNTRRTTNANPMEPLQAFVRINNAAPLSAVFQMNREVVRREMVRRTSDPSCPRRLRNLAAGLLMIRNDETGRDYFRKQCENPDLDIGGVCWEFGRDALGGNPETSEYPDMNWAEGLMITALQDRRNLSRAEVYRNMILQNVSFMENQKQTGPCRT